MAAISVKTGIFASPNPILILIGLDLFWIGMTVLGFYLDWKKARKERAEQYKADESDRSDSTVRLPPESISMDRGSVDHTVKIDVSMNADHIKIDFNKADQAEQPKSLKLKRLLLNAV
jgi:hypothetical protein